MRLFISIFPALFLYSCISTKGQTQTNGITAINYSVKFPVVQGDKEYLDFGKTTPIYYYQDLTIYQLPYTFDSIKTTYHVKADTVSTELILSEIRYNYFVYRHGSRKGIWYNSLEHLDSTQQFFTDSILKRLGIPSNIQSLVYSPNDTLFDRTMSDNGNIIIEKYIHKSKPDESYNDTTLLYYSKMLKPIRFSLSPFLDSLNNSKLYKLRLAFNETYSQTYSITMPQRDIIYEIVKLDLTNIPNLKSLIRRFKQDEILLF